MGVEKYTIDLDTILQILQSFHRSGTLQGDLPARKLNNKVPWQAQLRLLEGEVTACSILDERGAVVQSGGVAFKSLQKVGKINWTMIQESEQTSHQPAIRFDRVTGHLPSNPQLPVPFQTEPHLSTGPYGQAPRPLVARRLMHVTVEQMNQEGWPRNYRQVYAMADGTRTIEKIATLLALHPQEVASILYDLQRRRVLILE